MSCLRGPTYGKLLYRIAKNVETKVYGFRTDFLSTGYRTGGHRESVFLLYKFQRQQNREGKQRIR